MKTEDYCECTVPIHQMVCEHRPPNDMQIKNCGCYIKDMHDLFNNWTGIEQFWCTEHSKDVWEKYKK